MSVLLLAMTAVLSGLETPVLDRDVRRASRSNSLLRSEPYRRDQPIDSGPDVNSRPIIITSNIHYFTDRIFAARRYFGEGFELKVSLGEPPAKGWYRARVEFRMVYTDPNILIKFTELVPYSPENASLNGLMMGKIEDMSDKAPRGLRMRISDNGNSIIVL